MSEMGDDFREHREYKRQLRDKNTVNYPGCKQKEPKRTPTRLWPGQTCRVCSYYRPKAIVGREDLDMSHFYDSKPTHQSPLDQLRNHHAAVAKVVEECGFNCRLLVHGFQFHKDGVFIGWWPHTESIFFQGRFAGSSLTDIIPALRQANEWLAANDWRKK